MRLQTLYVELSIHDRERIMAGVVNFPWSLKFHLDGIKYELYKNSLTKNTAVFYADGHIRDYKVNFEERLEDFIELGAKDINNSSYEQVLISSGFSIRNPSQFFLNSGGEANETLDSITLIEYTHEKPWVFRASNGDIILESDFHEALKVAHYLEWQERPFQVAPAESQ
jgi:hypothetical protein